MYDHLILAGWMHSRQKSQHFAAKGQAHPAHGLRARTGSI
jgi:hypothetical protein